MRLPFTRQTPPLGPPARRNEPAVILTGLKRHHEVMVIIALATVVRMVGFTAPYTSQHWIKQLQIAPIAKNFHVKSPNILWPETDYSADEPGYIEIEFQLVTWLTALLYKVFGIHEWVGRLVTIGFSVGSMVLFYRLVLMYLGPASAGYGLFFFAFAPSNWYFSRVLMSEPLMIFFSIALMYSFSLWLGSGARKHWVWAVITGALCFLVKLPTMLLIIPLYFIAAQKFKSKVLRQRELWALAALTILPAAAYYLHARYRIGEHYFTVGVGFGGAMWFSPQHFLVPGNYSLMMERLVRQHLTPVGTVLLALGVLTAVNARVRLTLFHVWLAAVALYFVIVSGGNIRQNYYQLHLIPPAAALIGLGWEQLVASHRFGHQLKSVLAVMLVVFAVWGVQPMFERYDAIQQASTELDIIDPSGEPVMIFPAGYGCLYYFSRPGWVGREGFGKPQGAAPAEDIPGPDYIDARIERGAKWLVFFITDAEWGQPLIRDYVCERFLCVSDTKEYQIFDLGHTPSGGVYQPLGPPASDESEGGILRGDH